MCPVAPMTTTRLILAILPAKALVHAILPGSTGILLAGATRVSTPRIAAGSFTGSATTSTGVVRQTGRDYRAEPLAVNRPSSLSARCRRHRALTWRVASVTESRRDRGPAVVGLEPHATPVPSQIRSAGWLRNAVLPTIVSKFGLLPLVSACALATTMPPELNCLPLLPTRVVRHQGVGRAEQQDAAALDVHRVVAALRAELVVLDHAVVEDRGVTRATWLAVVQDHDALAVPAELVVRRPEHAGRAG